VSASAEAPLKVVDCAEKTALEKKKINPATEIILENNALLYHSGVISSDN
jgi:hypothetical protein